MLKLEEISIPEDLLIYLIKKNNTCYFGQCGLIMQKMLGMLGTFCRNCAWMMPCHLTFNFIVLKIFASNKIKKLKNTYRRA